MSAASARPAPFALSCESPLTGFQAAFRPEAGPDGCASDFSATRPLYDTLTATADEGHGLPTFVPEPEPT